MTQTSPSLLIAWEKPCGHGRRFSSQLLTSCLPLSLGRCSWTENFGMPVLSTVVTSIRGPGLGLGAKPCLRYFGLYSISRGLERDRFSAVDWEWNSVEKRVKLPWLYFLLLLILNFSIWVLLGTSAGLAMLQFVGFKSFLSLPASGLFSRVWKLSFLELFKAFKSIQSSTALKLYYLRIIFRIFRKIYCF